MRTTRRRFLTRTLNAAALPVLTARAAPVGNTEPTDEAFVNAAAKPVLDLKGIKGPVIIESIQLLKKGRQYFLRVRSKDGAEGM